MAIVLSHRRGKTKFRSGRDIYMNVDLVHSSLAEAALLLGDVRDERCNHAKQPTGGFIIAAGRQIIVKN